MAKIKYKSLVDGGGHIIFFNCDACGYESSMLSAKFNQRIVHVCPEGCKNNRKIEEKKLRKRRDINDLIYFKCELCGRNTFQFEKVYKREKIHSCSNGCFNNEFVKRIRPYTRFLQNLDEKYVKTFLSTHAAADPSKAQRIKELLEVYDVQEIIDIVNSNSYEETRVSLYD